MAHFAQLDENNIVLRVIVVGNADASIDGVESEAAGIAFCRSLFGADTTWLQTSYNGSIRKNYAGAGYTYDAVRNAFIPPKPDFPSWILDEDTCLWIAPVPIPPTGGPHTWNEESREWEGRE